MSSKKKASWRWAAVPAVAATIAFGAASLPAQAAVPQAPAPQSDQWIVSLGDSFISGEGGNFSRKGGSPAASNWTRFNSAQIDTTAAHQNSMAYSGYVYGDAGAYSAANSNEQIDYCHRSDYSPGHLVGSYQMMNLACSGATVPSHGGAGQNIKPGIDFETTDGVLGQAALLQDFAADHDIKVVNLSIGGNDLGFADIATACIQAFVPFIGNGGHCATKSKADDPLNPGTQAPVATLVDDAHIAAVRAKITTAVTNVVAAMREAGHADGTWKLVYQTPPMPVTDAAHITWDESGFFSKDRQTSGGCGISNSDITWIYSTVYPRLQGAMKNAIADAQPVLGGTPVTLLDTEHAFDGHKLCEKGNAVDPAKTATWLLNLPGQTDPKNTAAPPGAVPWEKANGDKAEWVNPAAISEALGGDKHPKQTPLHPNYWGQRALSACTDAALGAGTDNTIVKCIKDVGTPQDAKGRPAMKIDGAAAPIVWNTPSAPVLAQPTNGDAQVTVPWTAPTSPGTSAIVKYQYSMNITPDSPGGNQPFVWRDVPGGATPANPLVITEDEDGQPLINGEGYTVSLRAVNNAGAGLMSNQFDVMPAAPPVAPTINSATGAGGSATLNVTNNDPVDPPQMWQYRINTPVGQFQDWTDLPGQSFSPLTIPGLLGDVEYGLQVRIITPTGTSDASNQVLVTPGPQGARFVPIAPTRVYDSRTPAEQTGGTMNGGGTGDQVMRLVGVSKGRDVNTGAITDPNLVPPEATAVAYNVTAINTTGSGYLSVEPGTSTDPKSSAVNWSGPTTVANALQVATSVGEQLRLKIGGGSTADVAIDVTGYYLPHTLPASDGKGIYTPLPEPLRAVDTRDAGKGGPVLPGTSRTVNLDDIGAGAIPDNATAAAFNLTVAAPETTGFLSLQPASTNAINSSTVNWTQVGTDLANASVVKLDDTAPAGDKHKVKVFSGMGAKTNFVIDVTGYFVPSTANPSEVLFYPLTTPERAWDSRAALPSQGKLDGNAGPRQVELAFGRDVNGNVIDPWLIPDTSVAASVNTTVADTEGTGYITVAGGDAATAPNTSTVNWSEANTLRANGIITSVNAAGEAKVWTKPTSKTNAIFDVFGYYAPKPVVK